MTIKPGEKLFQFASKQDWINKAQRIWRFHGVRAESTVCVDQQGRICTIGLHFMAGYESEAGFTIGLNYLRGVSNLRNSSNHDWRNHVFSVSVGYLFGD